MDADAAAPPAGAVPGAGSDSLPQEPVPGAGPACAPPAGSAFATPGPVTVEIHVPDVTPRQAWEFAWSAAVLPRWFGSAPPGPSDGYVQVGVLGVRPRDGVLSTIQHRASITFAGGPAAPGPAPGAAAGAAAGSAAVITVTPARSGGARVRVVEQGFATPDDAARAQADWRRMLGNLERDLLHARNRAVNPRQAVVVFHGIGNQQPGQTLQALVHSGVIGEPGTNAWIKPDRISDDFELHTCTFKATKGQIRPTTDVYEAYWANLVTDTTTSQVTSWIAALLTKFHGVPRPLAAMLWLVRGLILLGIAGFVLLTLLRPAVIGWFGIGWVAASVGVVTAVVKALYTGVIGDAARYLRPLPENVETRRRVRERGVDLIDGLHRSGRYDRIVVLGHSLGSVVAYDVLTEYWVRTHRIHRSPTRPRFTAMRAVERAAAKPSVTAGAAQTLQRSAWHEIRRNTQPWLVTDLVTVGSPLTYAPILVRPNRSAFDAAIDDRILPTCPPRLETQAKPAAAPLRRFSYEQPYVESKGRERTFTLLDHAAPFAVTRWTNLFFQTSLLGLHGDPVGGPVAPAMGAWVRDVPLASAGWFGKAHTGYWRPGTTVGDAHLAALRVALGMFEGQNLRDLAADRPLPLP